MKRTLFILFLAFSSSLFAKAPSWLKKVRQTQVSVIAYNSRGEMKESQGVWLNGDGVVVTDYDVMKDAVRAVVTDFSGKEYDISTILGANSTYNVAVLQTSASKTKYNTQEMIQPVEGQHVFTMPNFHADKAALCTEDTVTKVEHFKSVYNYLTLKNAPSQRQISCPVISEDGNIIGILQNAVKAGSPGFVIDTRFASDIKISTLDATNKDYKDIHIRKALPDNDQDAASFIYLTGTADTTMYLAYADDFIKKFPSNTNGYIIKAEMLASAGRFDNADEVYAQALAVKGIAKDEVLYSKSRIAYQNAVRAGNNNPHYTLQQALSWAEEAYASNPLPLYTSMQGYVLYAMKDYQRAADKYLSLSTTNLRSPENFLYAAQCRQMCGDSISAIIALQDSALSCYSKPYPKEAAGVIMMRARNLAQAGKYREAVAGYNDYEHLAGGKELSADFYEERSELEIQCRMYTAALNDLERASKLSPQDAALRTQLAATYYRVNQMEEAVATVREAISIDSNFPDAWRILGICLRQQGKEAEAIKALQKAAELGDEIAKKQLTGSAKE